MTVRAVVTGAAGRMGSSIIRAIETSDDFTLVAATEKTGSTAVGLDAGLAAGLRAVQVTVTSDFTRALEKADVVIDFTNASASVEHARVCAKKKVPLIVGSTGFSAGARADIAGCGQKIPVMMAPNMSVAVSLLFRLAHEAARVLGDGYDVEIVETHHRHKKDAPSGTALRLAEMVADALGRDPVRDVVYARQGDVGERKAKEIGVQSLRGGDVIGDHTVYFLGDGEQLALTHRATSRETFARGALRAAAWIVGKKPGLYDMQDVLGLR